MAWGDRAEQGNTGESPEQTRYCNARNVLSICHCESEKAARCAKPGDLQNLKTSPKTRNSVVTFYLAKGKLCLDEKICVSFWSCLSNLIVRKSTLEENTTSVSVR